MCFFFSLLETVLEAFHFDHETLEKQLTTIENQGELSAPDAPSDCSENAADWHIFTLEVGYSQLFKMCMLENQF